MLKKDLIYLLGCATETLHVSIANLDIKKFVNPQL